MELTKEYISRITFTCKRKKFYSAFQVDNCLDEIADAADKLQKELTELRQKAAEYDKMQNSIAAALVTAERNADEIMERANAERAELLAGAEGEKEQLESANDEMFQQTMQLKKALTGYTSEMERWVNRVLAIHNGGAADKIPGELHGADTLYGYEKTEMGSGSL